jgi:hypothetical protein
MRGLLGMAAMALLPAGRLWGDPYANDLDHYKAGVFKTPEQQRRRSCLPPGQRLFFNGEDFHYRACEGHVREGWVIEVQRTYAYYDDGVRFVKSVSHHKRYGRVELRPA